MYIADAACCITLTAACCPAAAQQLQLKDGAGALIAPVDSDVQAGEARQPANGGRGATPCSRCLHISHAAAHYLLDERSTAYSGILTPEAPTSRLQCN